MARCRYHFLKYRTDKMSDEYMKIMKSALECAQKTVKLNPECGPGHKVIDNRFNNLAFVSFFVYLSFCISGLL